MEDLKPGSAWIRGVSLRGVLIGLALGAVGIAGSSVVLSHSGTGMINASVLAGTVLFALTIGVWAGSPDAIAEELQIREKWVTTAATFAIAGAFGTVAGLYAAARPGPWWGVGALLMVVAAPTYVLGTLIPALLAWADRLHDQEVDSDDGWGALGPLTLGILGGCALSVLVTGLLVLPLWGGASELMAISLLLLLPVSVKDRAATPSREAEIYSAVTPFGALRVTDVAFPGERQPERRLYLNDEEESGQLVRSGAPTLAYIAAAESWLSQVTPPGASYLFLGGGAYTLPRRIGERDPKAKITVVELDPEITRIAYRFFGLKTSQGILSIQGDARAFLAARDGDRFERIYVDVYSGKESLPHSLVTREAAEAVRARLAPGGIAAVNVIGIVSGAESRQLWSIVRSYAEVFPTLKLYSHLGSDFAERQNLLLAVAVDPATVLPSRAGLFEEWPRAEWPDVAGLTVFRDLTPTGSSEAVAEHKRRV